MDNARTYETKVAFYLVDNNPDFLVRYNQSVVGQFSKASRQIDILLINRRQERKIVVECKYYNKKIDVKILEGFISFLDDINIKEGILITNMGTSKAAVQRILKTEVNIQILNDNDLKNYDLTALITYEGNRAVFLFQPYGWNSIGAVPKFRTCCMFIPIGSSLEDIMIEGNFLYLNLFDDNLRLQEELEQEITDINNKYNGKKTHKIYYDEITYRKSYIFSKKRYDSCLIKNCKIGFVILHGILKPQDLAWTITAMKKILNKAMMMNLIDNTKKNEDTKTEKEPLP